MPKRLDFDCIIDELAQNPKLPEVANEGAACSLPTAKQVAIQANIFVSPSTAIA